MATTALKDFKSVRDFAVAQSAYELTGEGYARWAGANIAGFPEISQESREEFYAGYLVTYCGLPKHAPVKYIREGNDTYIPVTKDMQVPEKAEIVTFSPAVAMNYTAQAFGTLRKDNPNMHSIIKQYRDAFSKFSTQKLARLIADWKALPENAVPRERAVNADFSAACKKALDGLETRNKNALAKGDTTAVGTEKFKHAMRAFFEALK
jgi:hypothetical protein